MCIPNQGYLQYLNNLTPTSKKQAATRINAQGKNVIMPINPHPKNRPQLNKHGINTQTRKGKYLKLKTLVHTR